MADVKIKIVVDNSGAITALDNFNKSLQKIVDTQKLLGIQSKDTFKGMRIEANKAKGTLKGIGTSAKAGMTKARGEIKKTKTEVTGLGTAAKQIRNIFAGVFIADTLRATINGIKRAVVGAVTEFADFETGLIGVGKTADISGKELKKFGEDIKDMDIAATNKDLLELAKTAGQLGIKGSDNLLKFTSVMAKLQSATNVAGEEGANAIARILNVTGTATSEVEKFGSALVQLGNNSAATESEILSVATRVAQQTAVFDVAAEDTLAFGAAMASMGIRAEAGGSSIGKAFKAIDGAVNAGGKSLEGFAKVMGITSEQLKEDFSNDKTAVILNFLQALGTKGNKVTDTLKKLGLTDIRVSATLGTLAKNIGVVNSSFTDARQGFEENTALNKEYERTLDSLNSLWIELKKSLSNLAVEVVGTLKPAFEAGLRAGKAFVDFLTSKPFEPEISIDKMSDDQIAEKYKEVEDQIKTLEKTQKQYAKNLSGASLRGYAKEIDKLRDKLEEFDNESRQRVLDGHEYLAINSKQQADAELARIKEQNQAKLTLENIFIDAKNQLLQNENKAEDEAEVLRKDTLFLNMEEAFGRRQALRITHQAAELMAAGEHEKALALVEKEGAKARQKNAEDFSKSLLELEKKTAASKGSVSSSYWNLAGSIAKNGSKAQFAIQKAAAMAEVWIAGKKAEALILATPPGPLYTAPLAAASMSKTYIDIAAIGASAIQGFENGGVVGGSSFTGDNVTAKVNSGEMILNRQQQSTLFKQANGEATGGGKDINTHITVKLDEEVVARAVSRQVANGFKLGEQT